MYTPPSLPFNARLHIRFMKKMETSLPSTKPDNSKALFWYIFMHVSQSKKFSQHFHKLNLPPQGPCRSTGPPWHPMGGHGWWYHAGAAPPEQASTTGCQWPSDPANKHLQCILTHLLSVSIVQQRLSSSTAFIWYYSWFSSSLTLLHVLKACWVILGFP